MFYSCSSRLLNATSVCFWWESVAEPKIITCQYLDLLPKLSPEESCKFLLSAISSCRHSDLQAEEPLDPSFISDCISPTGIQEVEGEFDPLSNMCQVPVLIGNKIWPTREHVIVYWKLISSSFLDLCKITPALKSLDTGFATKSLVMRIVRSISPFGTRSEKQWSTKYYSLLLSQM